MINIILLYIGTYNKRIISYICIYSLNIFTCDIHLHIYTCIMIMDNIDHHNGAFLINLILTHINA